MKKAAVFLADGFEEIEGLTAVDMCRRAGIDVTTVSVMETLDIMGSHDIPVQADALFNEVDFDAVDMFILPGGGKGTENLEKCRPLADLLLKADKDDKYISAICAAPRVLGKLGLLKGHKATCYPGNEGFLEGAEYLPEAKAVKSGRYVTARGMGCSIEFASAVVSQLLGQDAATELEKQIQFS